MRRDVLAIADLWKQYNEQHEKVCAFFCEHKSGVGMKSEQFDEMAAMLAKLLVLEHQLKKLDASCPTPYASRYIVLALMVTLAGEAAHIRLTERDGNEDVQGCGMMVIFLLMTVLYLPIFASDSSLPSLTPNGNMTLVDDYVIGDTQYITVQTKSGNYFYIIIDRSGETDNVHFLNKVDEADLLPLLDKEFDFGTDPDTPEELTELVEPDDKAEQRKEVLTRGLVLAGIFAAVGGGIYIISKKKPKKEKEKPENEYDDTEDAVSENTYVRDTDSESEEVTVYENDADEDEDEYEDD